MKPRIKICCISSPEEARMAIACGADALGLVGHMPSGPGVISDEQIKEIVQLIPPTIATFLLTSETKVEKIIAHHAKVNTNVIQMVDELKGGAYQQLRAALPGVKLVQVIHVIDEASVEEAIKVSAAVDAILLDSGNPNLQVKVLGGTGKTHNWEFSRAIRDKVSIPLFLAGGLNANNVKEAIDTVQPFGLDLCSGVRTDGRLDRGKLEAFFAAI